MSLPTEETKFPVYKVRSFDDLMNAITEENCDMIFGNFYGCVKTFLEVKKNHPEMKMLGFDWIDDGKIELKEPDVSKRFKIALCVTKIEEDGKTTE